MTVFYAHLLSFFGVRLTDGRSLAHTDPRPALHAANQRRQEQRHTHTHTEAARNARLGFRCLFFFAFCAAMRSASAASSAVAGSLGLAAAAAAAAAADGRDRGRKGQRAGDQRNNTSTWPLEAVSPASFVRLAWRRFLSLFSQCAVWLAALASFPRLPSLASFCEKTSPASPSLISAGCLRRSTTFPPPPPPPSSTCWPRTNAAPHHAAHRCARALGLRSAQQPRHRAAEAAAPPFVSRRQHLPTDTGKSPARVA